MAKQVTGVSNTNRHSEVRLYIDDIDMRKLKRVKAHYQFDTYQETIAALIKRAIISIDTGH